MFQRWNFDKMTGKHIKLINMKMILINMRIFILLPYKQITMKRLLINCVFCLCSFLIWGQVSIDTISINQPFTDIDLCTNTTHQLNYSVNVPGVFQAGNTFVAQLSDAIWGLYLSH